MRYSDNSYEDFNSLYIIYKICYTLYIIETHYILYVLYIHIIYAI